MKTTPTDGVRRRIGTVRKLAGITQSQLAAAAHVSVSLVAKVESGQRPASPAFTAAVAKALGVDVTALTGEPYRDLVSDPRSEAAGIPALRQVLSEHDNPAPVTELISLDELRARLEAATRLHFRARYAELSRRLPELLRHLYVHWADPPRGERDRENLAILLDDAYALTASTIYRFGFLDLAELVDARRPFTAAATGDPLRMACAAFGQTRLPKHRGDYGGCTRRLDGALDLVDNVPGANARAVRGQFHLRQATVAALATKGSDAEAHLAEARHIVASGVPARPYVGIDCSVFNVDSHYVTVPFELLDGTTAIARASTVHIPADTAPHTVGQYWIKVARGWVLHGDRTKAIEALNQARAVAPQQTRYHHSVRDLVHTIAATNLRATDSLRGFARWAGITL